MNNQNNEKSYKVLILGNQGAGKTAIANAWKNGNPPPKRGYKPTVCDTYVDQIVVDEQRYQLELTDTAGLDEYSFFPGEYGDLTLSDYNAFIIVYAINNGDSLEVAEKIKCKLENKLFVGDHGTKMENDNNKFTALKMKILLVANKSDLEEQREVSSSKGREMARSWQLADDAFREVSATRPTEIKCLFESIIRMLDESISNEQEGKKICTIS